ncbi:acylphosphatase [Candidatus Bathyarchaeota archaeon]|nr:acylphosphatase [Candidatus Bathyarchaeota archaeon]
MKVRIHMLVSGRVQGVFYRSEACKEARKLGVTGWIRNLPDGRVEAVFEGEKENVKMFLAFCRRGPEGARVDRVEIKNEAYTGEFKSFEIRY